MTQEPFNKIRMQMSAYPDNFEAYELLWYESAAKIRNRLYKEGKREEAHEVFKLIKRMWELFSQFKYDYYMIRQCDDTRWHVYTKKHHFVDIGAYRNDLTEKYPNCLVIGD